MAVLDPTTSLSQVTIFPLISVHCLPIAGNRGDGWMNLVLGHLCKAREFQKDRLRVPLANFPEPLAFDLWPPGGRNDGWPDEEERV